MKTTALPILLASLILVSGCSSHQAKLASEENITTQKRQALPITQVVQTMNLPYHRAWDTLIQILAQRGIKTDLADKKKGEIQSEWISIRDRLCGTYPSYNAPLSCRVRYSMKLEPITRKASSFTINYVENCRERQHLNLECPGSNAEKIMMLIVDDIKAAAGIID